MIPWQEPPPYVQYMSEAENVGRMAFAAGVCSGMDLLVSDPQKIEAAVDDFQRRAVIARVWGPFVQQSFHEGVAKEERESAFLFDIPDGLPEDEAARRMARLDDYLVERCGWVLREFPGVASLPPEE